jgi:hypothetical protein
VYLFFGAVIFVCPVTSDPVTTSATRIDDVSCRFIYFRSSGGSNAEIMPDQRAIL